MSDVMVVTSMPVYGRILHGLRDHLSKTGLNGAVIVSALSEHSEEKLSVKQIKDLAADLYPVIEERQPKYLVTLGAEAWTAVTGKTNVTRYRGRLYDNPLVSGGVVFPTISQAMVYRKPSEKVRWYAELSYLARLAEDGSVVPRDHSIPQGSYHVVGDKAGLKACREDLAQAEIVSYDIETVGRGEVDPNARIVSIALTLEDEVCGKRVWAIPLYHPDSPFLRTWRSVLRALAKWLCRVPVRIAHNCFTGDTKYITDKGIRELRDLGPVTVWDGEQWVQGVTRHYGQAPTKKITLTPARRRSSIKQELTATLNHKWITESGDVVTTDELEIGDVLAATWVDVTPNEDSEGFRHGLLFADGSLQTTQPRDGSHFRYQIRLCGAKAKWLSVFPHHTYPVSYEGDPLATGRMEHNPKDLPGSWADAQYIADFIHGWQLLDGTDYGNGCRDVRTVHEAHSSWLQENAAIGGWFCAGASHHSYPGNGYNGTDIYSIILTKRKGAKPPAWRVRAIDNGPVTDVFCVEAEGKFTLAGGVLTGNSKYDTKWLNHFDVPIIPTDDTIMMLALLDENARKTLKIAAQVWLGADPWGVDTSKLLDMPLAEVLEYNALDTWHTLRLWHVLRRAMTPEQVKLYSKVSMPIVCELVHIERTAIYVDQEKLALHWNEVKKTLADIDRELMTHVPPVAEWPKKPPTKTGLIKPAFAKPNFNASKFSRWLLYDHFGLPVLERTPSGDESMSQHVLKKLADEHPVPAIMVKRTKWNKLDTAFFAPWAEQLAISPRLHTTFKPWGTVTGRLSSGREDEDKITVSRDTMLGVNIQQIPRMKLARGVFGAQPGWMLVVADYSQIELRIAAFMARERRMLELYRTGADIHTTTAQQMVGDREVTKADRTAAKAVNFGYLYGMGWLKFIELAWNNYGLRVTEEEAQAFRVAFFRAYPDLLPWHDRQRKLVNKFKRVRTPMGRIRHLPDIDSPDKGVRGEAERQAINSPVQAFASDITVLSVIGTGARLREAGLQTRCVGTVHDSILFEAPVAELPTVLPLIKSVMENPPLDRFGIVLDVPLVADIELGSHWADMTTVTEEMMTDYDKLTSITERYQR